MNTIHAGVPGREYDILIGRRLLDRVGELAKSALRAEKLAVITDSNVYPLYGARLVSSLEKAGFCVTTHVFPAGEASKNLATYAEVLSFLAENHLTRADAIVALGGGVVGDLAGFAAATYLRGIDFVQVPTTLLAAVDSSVGGKTAVDLPAGKNLVGAFWQPSLVVCDPDTLATLPDAEFTSGMAEVIKYAAIKDAGFYDMLAPGMDLSAVIARCVEIKRDVVFRDERDTGERQLLNFGHTFGHAVELLSNFSIPHGNAVAIGMVMMARAAVKKGIAAPDVVSPLLAAIRAFGLPDACPYAADEVYQITLSDKKRETGTISLIVPTAIGRCERMKVDLVGAREMLELALSEGENA